jgi:outer membrane lipoprotein SlyB
MPAFAPMAGDPPRDHDKSARMSKQRGNAMNRFARQIVAAIATALMLAAGAAAQGTCADCGRVQSIRYVEQQGEESGVGLVAGGVLGGVLGHQIGSGRGNTAATIAGAGLGAYAGHQVEKNRNRKSYWSVAIRMDNGNTRSFTYSSKPAVHEGERVKLVDGGRRLALLAR